MVNALFTALAVIAAGQAEIPSSRSSVADMRDERVRAAIPSMSRVRRERAQARSREG